MPSSRRRRRRRFLSNFKWPEDPLNLVKIKNRFGSIQTNPQANAWWVGHIFFLKKLYFWYTLVNINSESCEQTNSILRRIAHSTTYMSPKLYMRSLTLFLADLNLCAKKNKRRQYWCSRSPFCCKICLTTDACCQIGPPCQRNACIAPLFFL